MISPVFIISLPRSGSTLLQRILMSHPQVASHSEPWFLLPLVYGMKGEGIAAEYGQKSASIAQSVLFDSLGGKAVYEQLLAETALNVYQQLSDGKHYFVDKTPRYYLIARDLLRLFPEAKFIVLLRNPLSVLASNIEAFKSNSLKRLDHLDRDLYQGPECLMAFLADFADRENVISLEYADLVSSPERVVNRLTDFLNLDFEPAMLTQFSEQKMEGYGDHLGARQFSAIQNQNEKWKQVLNTPARKQLAKHYLQRLPEGYFEQFGHSRKGLLADLESYSTSQRSLIEYGYLFQSTLIRWMKRLFKYKTLA